MTANANSLPPTALERVLARDRRVIAAALATLVVLSWIYLLFLSRQMDADAGTAALTPMPAMPGMPGMPGMTDATAASSGGAARELALAALMWWTMMIGMMVPSAAPMILLFGNVQRRQLATESPRLRVALFTAAYLAIWGAFSALAAAAQLVLARLEWLETMDLTVTASASAVLLALAGCCWLLMALLFAVGVMNLLWVAAIALFVMAEKLLPGGETTAKVAGLALLSLAGYLAISA
jgi:predicted metal-binding membrane protein